MIRDDYTAWDECPDVDNCELIQSFLELVDSMVKDIQHLKAETVKARYELSQKLDPEHQWTTGADILSDLDTPHYDNLAYQEYMRIYYDDVRCPENIRSSAVESTLHQHGMRLLCLAVIHLAGWHLSMS